MLRRKWCPGRKKQMAKQSCKWGKNMSVEWKMQKPHTMKLCNCANRVQIVKRKCKIVQRVQNAFNCAKECKMCKQSVNVQIEGKIAQRSEKCANRVQNAFNCAKECKMCKQSAKCRNAGCNCAAVAEA